MFSDRTGLCTIIVCPRSGGGSYQPPFPEEDLTSFHDAGRVAGAILSESTPYGDIGAAGGPKYQFGPAEVSGGISSTLRITSNGVSSVDTTVGVEGSLSGNRNGAGSVNASGGISVTEEGVTLIRPSIGGSASKGAASATGTEVGIGFTTTPQGGIYLGAGFILPNPQRRSQIIGQILSLDSHACGKFLSFVIMEMRHGSSNRISQNRDNIHIIPHNARSIDLIPIKKPSSSNVIVMYFVRHSMR